MVETRTFASLADKLSGNVIEPGHSEYDEARRVWNGMIDRRPAAIVRCESSEDVVSALNFAREQGLAFSVRCGGHGVSGNSIVDGGLLIDLSPMRAVKVDAETRTATAQGGARLGDLDREAQAHGLATTAGIDPGTGVGGLTLGGGTGFLARKLGLTIDSLIGAQVVLADGSLVTASRDEHPDLFWAIRGGGGNFGIVTQFEFRLHPIGPELMTSQVFYPFEAARAALRFYRDFMRDAPEEVGCYLLFVPVPPAEPFPEELHGKTAVALAACYVGDLDRGKEILEPLTQVADPLLTVVQPMGYADLQSSFKDAAPDGERYYWKSHFLEDIPDDLINLVVDRTREQPGSFTNTFFESQGGAVNRVAVDATAFPHRNARFTIGISAGWSDPEKDEQMIKWARGFHDAVTPHSTGGVYSNYMDFDEDERVRGAYGSNFERLREIKAKYDPNNVFRMNQNIKPAT